VISMKIEKLHQIALRAENIDESVEFYPTSLRRTSSPNSTRPGWLSSNSTECG